MDIEAKEYTIKLSQSELWDTAFDVRRALEATLKDHWVNHQNAWRKNEEKRIARHNAFFIALGRPYEVQYLDELAEKIFKEFNDKQKK